MASMEAKSVTVFVYDNGQVNVTSQKGITIHRGCNNCRTACPLLATSLPHGCLFN